MKVFIIGAGTMGSGIAQVFATKGFQTILCDIEDKFVEMGYSIIEKKTLLAKIKKIRYF